MLSLTLSGCLSNPVVKEVPVTIGTAYTEPTPEPKKPTSPVTNGALVKYAQELLAALRSANADKLTIRIWGEQATEQSAQN